MKVLIEKMDHLARGIGYINQKVVFIPFTTVGDEVEIEITKDNKNYMEGKVINYLNFSQSRVKPFCPYFEKCGVCFLQHLSYKDSLNYKKQRIQNILNRVGIKTDVNMIQNEINRNYRNKIELKIVDGKVGFYRYKSHDIVEIFACNIAKKCLNDVIDFIKTFKIKDGLVTLRCNYNDEVLISITSKDVPVLNTKLCPNYKIVGIILNDKVIYGEDKFLDMVNNFFFEVSYNSFFQVNPYINSKLFDIISENVEGKNVLDLYSGVGTLSLMASQKANKVFGIEIVQNAVLNAIKNAKINNIDNVYFICGKVEEKAGLIKEDIDAVIVDPPRAGLDNNTINLLKNIMPSKIIYISCETQKMASDLEKLLSLYNASKVYGLDMFSYSYHCETICVLERR